MTVTTSVRFNLVQPEQPPGPAESAERPVDRYRAALEMAGYADEHGVTSLIVEEHHGAPDGWLPSPLALAGAFLGRTRTTLVTACAILAPLYDPLRLAEDIAVLDLASGGRLVTVAGIGYRPEEYAALGWDFSRRGALQDEVLETLLAAWTGEPFSYRGRTVRVTPRPYSSPHPPLFVGGSSRPAARRAARLGLPLFLPAHLPQLERYYEERCAAAGGAPLCVMPPPELPVVHLTDDPDRAWAELGEHFLYEARRYAAWQTPDVHSAMRAQATTVAELRAEGVYRFVTPDECLAVVERQPAGARQVLLHPLCGGMPVEEGRRSLRLLVEEVMPRLKGLDG
ncbi:LLM class flavin-dependent oxidoreductase [Streptomyces sp. RK75]|uniref:LLM class flavin-dependent oxidoreductase n=1 Tax=Streptomyces sp. RK75 TaxID=2824895 RepID=UPI001B38DA7B|nr:LLM class flavin-dependent oxidoreductase [Streptomyces sp. RK75]MBQ0865374.1 LLM class flavin-dependent oxidoreductase [Streptomyces sp. RK75]